MLGTEHAGALVGLLALAAVSGVLFVGLCGETVAVWLSRDTGSRTTRRPRPDPDRTPDETALPDDPRED
ncbi:hypothetical protein [Halostella litorea]|uniref:hypothetical protein n=1 Tax=Halostella litorea TaxID=2528831 RepID=UPI001091B809|nr:hypothetical protein [Halostella litorea]